MTNDSFPPAAAKRHFMPVKEVTVRAPSRLHFGLLAPTDSGARKFGGVGAMIDRPSVKLRFTRSAQFAATGPLADRVEQFAATWSAARGLSEIPSFEVEVLAVPRQHAGLGVGTQLAMSVASGLHACLDEPVPTPAELAMSVGRGRRSAIGSYGFSRGGLIVERGMTKGEPFAPLDCHVTLPESWRFVLVCPKGRGLAGRDEQQAFDELPRPTGEQSDQLVREIREVIVPAAMDGDFVRLSRGLFRYGHAAGMCFSGAQGGPYNGPRLEELVRLIRSFGIEGVGQSSWGPTLFALTDGDEMAAQLSEKLRDIDLVDEADVWVSPVNNSGATVRASHDHGDCPGESAVRATAR